MDNIKQGCLVCGEELQYQTKETKKKCFYCNAEVLAAESCINGHYVCNSCHSASAFEIITNTCLNITEHDIIKLANTIFKHPSVKMHGPEHHFLVPAVLLASYQSDKKKLESDLEKAKNRAKNILGGFCGYYGTCGAAVGGGIFMSIITGSTPLSEKEWTLSNLLTSRILKQIADSGGPRCCKRDTYIALIETANFCSENDIGIITINSAPSCDFSHLNKQCKKEECIFFTETDLNLV